MCVKPVYRLEPAVEGWLPELPSAVVASGHAFFLAAGFIFWLPG